MKLRTENNTPISAISASMDVTKYIELNIDIDYKKTFTGELLNLWIKATSIHASTSAITMRITSDQAGDEIIVPDTTSAISSGLTTTSSGYAVWRLQTNWSSNIEKLFIFLAADHGTFNFEEAILVYEVIR